ncbi:MAG: hypothetical protein ACRDTT_03045 [Pseudonocardiaceae bacterium]
MIARRFIVAALSLAVLLSCDADGDGLDDTTGQPVPVRGDGDGCGPEGVEWLCSGSDDDSEYQASPRELAIAARHEAAHGVACRVLDGVVETTYIRPDGTGWTSCRMEDDPRLVIVYLAAGAAAGGRSDHDESEIEKQLRRIPSDDRDATESSARSESDRIVTSRSDEIDRVAADLLDQM